MQLVWNPGGGDCSITHEADGKKVHMIDLDTSTDIEYVEVKSCALHLLFAH